ncbi:sensor histidine kinase [Schaalia vaccimaxillae]|uniref:sensor histidine kinase n=1 Tax=Schaalia vaccimaxillae TaxID=183916 RepID=UPI00040E9E35|nr:ATP-binding protein [Schaalia vaccimaxillae]
MRKRAVRMILTVVTIVALVIGVPGAIASSITLWKIEEHGVESRAVSLLRTAERRSQDQLPLTSAGVEAWFDPLAEDYSSYYARIKILGQDLVSVGNRVTGPSLAALESTPSGTSIYLEVSANNVMREIVFINVIFAAGIIGCMLLGWFLAEKLARRLSAPLIYLAAQAEQIGSGQVRARVKPSGIEEIDLVQEELVRTGERMAGRLAAERQFAADASHQLRTPLTALSMRLEEIEMISTEPEVQAEARSCLEQVERMTGAVSDLLDTNNRGGGQTEAIHILEAFNVQREEWEPQFEREDRELIFLDEAEIPVLADSGKLAQVLATLIENSLHYGAGTTQVHARKTANKRGVIIEVSDQGEGVDDEIAPDVFAKGVSGHGSTGIGLALAMDLTNTMGGRLELTQNHPPIFSVSLAAIPASLDPDRVMPEGPVVSMGRRSRRF